jgi:hypothetical protein
VGGEFDLSYEIANVGTAAANNVVVQFQIPDFFTLIDLTVNGGSCATDRAECVLDRLSAGAVAVISATLSADTAGSFTINLDVSAPDDRDITSNTQSTSVTVVALPDLRVSISDVPSMPAGQSRQTSIRVENNSTVLATDVRVDVTSSNGLRIDSLVSSTGSCSIASCTVTTLPGFSTLQIDVAMTGVNEGAMAITASSTATEADVAPDDNTATIPVSVITPVAAPTSTNNNSAASGGGGGATHWFVTLLLFLIAAGKRSLSGVSQTLSGTHKCQRLHPR